MTLTEVANMIYSSNGDLTVCVFDEEGVRDEFRKGELSDGYLFAVKTPYRLHAVLREKYAKAQVEAICLVNDTTVDVIIRLEDE